MKITRLILLLAVLVVAGSCNKDDDNGPEPFIFNKDNLTGTYSLVFHESKKVKTIEVEGFNVTTTGKGDTFSVNWSFNSDNKITRNGTYRISSSKTQSGETQESAVIIVLDNEKSNYSVHTSNNQLTMDAMMYRDSNMTYKVTGFSRTGFTLEFSDTSVEQNGDTEIYEEELRFTR